MGNETLLNHLSTGTLLLVSYVTRQSVVNLFGMNASRLTRRRAKTYKSTVSFVLEREAIGPDSALAIKDLNELYIENLKSLGIQEKTQTTRFAQQLLNSIPNLVSSTVNKSTVILFGDKS